MRRDDIHDRFAERAQRSHGPFTRRHVAGVARSHYHDLLAMPVLGQEGQGRRLAQDHPGGELVGLFSRQATVVVKQLRRLAIRMDDQT
jgi:hypothetical protein